MADAGRVRSIGNGARGARQGPQDRQRLDAVMAAGLHIDEDQLGAEPPADQNILLEDVLVTGATFVACRQVLQARRMASPDFSPG